MKTVGIIGALDTEITLLKLHLKDTSTSRTAGMAFYSGKLNNIPVVIVKCGVGKVSAGICAQLLITKYKVGSIINTGIAGAISPRLKVFDLVVSDDAMYHDVDLTAFGRVPGALPNMPKAFAANSNMVMAAKNAFSDIINGKSDTKAVFHEGAHIYNGRIASGDQFISSQERKDQIEEIASPLCVEMEGAAIAQACYMNSVPFVIIRAISDNADDSGQETYNFNETEAAEMSAALVEKMLLFLEE